MIDFEKDGKRIGSCKCESEFSRHFDTALGPRHLFDPLVLKKGFCKLCQPYLGEVCIHFYI